jgi:L-iditol 2-dehydrogenase
MRALVKEGVGLEQLVLREQHPMPALGADEILVRVQAAAVCASDIHLWRDEFPCAPPFVLGHEFSGRVEQVGAGVTGIRAGDRVVSENNPCACGQCPACRAGYPNVCPAKRAIGFKSDGCFADYVKLPAALVHKVPANVPPAAAALSEPLAVATHAVEDRCGIVPGDTVVVLGPGAIGLLCAQVARAEGAGRVIVAGTDRDEPQRLACARQLGLETCNIQHEDLEARVKALTSGFGADVVVEAAGVAPAIASGIRLLRRAGRMVVLGLTGKPQISVEWDQLVSKGARVDFSFSSRRRNWVKAMEYLASGQVATLPLVTGRARLEDWQGVFNAMVRQETIRTVFEFAEAA